MNLPGALPFIPFGISRFWNLFRISDFGFRIYGASVLSFILLGAFQAFADSSQTYLDSLVDFERYAESVWHTASYSNAPADAGYWGDGGSSGNGGIRGNGGVAVAYAVLVSALPTDVKTPTRLARIRQALNYNTATHVTGTNLCADGHPWGWSSSSSTDWQTPLWTGSMGLACMCIQNQLPAGTVQAVQRVVASEATHRAGIAPASGYVGDTKAEENGWDSNVLALGAAWLSTNTNAVSWLTAAKKYLGNTYTVANTNGDPLAAWDSTVTLYPDFALENHGFYHPVYQMVAGMSAGDSFLMARLANPSIASQLQPFAEHNVLNVWTNLNHLLLDSGEFASPAGLDWELHDYEQNSYIAFLASHFNDSLARWADGQLAQLVRARQLVNGDGTFVGPSGGGFFREAVEARRTAIAWLHWANADFTNGPVATPPAAFEHLPDVGIITCRGSFGFVSICYGPQTNGSGARIMALIEPPVSAGGMPTNVYLTTPRLPGIIGLGALGTPTAARLVSLTLPPGGTNGFQAELQLTNGGNGTTEVYVNCTSDSVAIVEVPSPSSGVSGGSAGSFCIGIENDPLVGGSRLLEWLGGSAILTNRSGVIRNVTNNWACVAGRYGLAAGPAGYFNYQTASSYNRAGAAQDTLQFFPQATLGPRYAVWFPGKNAVQTMSNASQVSWSVSATNAILSFPGPGGSPAQIAAALAPAPTGFPPYLLPIAGITASSSQPGYPPTNAVDGNYSDFWVSSGGGPGQGPTASHPEWLQVAFPRPVAISEFQVAPRTLNGSYGPKAVQMLFNGLSVYQGTMAATATLDVHLPHPLTATNAQLVITSSYDPNYPTNSRNVQVVELTFFERALPGTFADWLLRNFSDAQIADGAVTGPQADPDADGVPNLVEFAVGGNPLAPDSAFAVLQPLSVNQGTLTLQFRERKNLGDVQRTVQTSSDLRTWTEVMPAALTNVADLGEAWLRQAAFPLQGTPIFFRLSYARPGA
jgi:hypothetical protein